MYFPGVQWYHGTMDLRDLYHRRNHRNDMLVKALQSHVRDRDRKPKYRGRGKPLAGHCYVLSEALYHLMGGRTGGYTPTTVRVDGEVHWFLRRVDRNVMLVLDPSGSQFDPPLYLRSGRESYGAGRGRGFLTRRLSRRARNLIRRARACPSCAGALGPEDTKSKRR